MQCELAIGKNQVKALLEYKPHILLEILYQADNKNLNFLIEQANKLGISVTQVKKSSLISLAGEVNPQGIIAKIKPQTKYTLSQAFDELKRKRDIVKYPPLIVILDEIVDVRNLAAIIRSSEALGADFVITQKHSAARLTQANQAVINKVSTGANLFLPVIEVANINMALKFLKENGVWVLGTSLEKASVLHKIDLTVPLAIILGAESTGMRKLLHKQCDFLAQIPMHGVTQSLNVSVACGICLYEVSRQRMALLLE